MAGTIQHSKYTAHEDAVFKVQKRGVSCLNLNNGIGMRILSLITHHFSFRIWAICERCSFSRARVARRTGQPIPWSAFRETLALPAWVFGPVALFQGCHDCII